MKEISLEGAKVLPPPLEPLTVASLIAELQKLDPQLPVLMYGFGSELFHTSLQRPIVRTDWQAIVYVSDAGHLGYYSHSQFAHEPRPEGSKRASEPYTAVILWPHPCAYEPATATKELLDPDLIPLAAAMGKKAKAKRRRR